MGHGSIMYLIVCLTRHEYTNFLPIDQTISLEEILNWRFQRSMPKQDMLIAASTSLNQMLRLEKRRLKLE